MSEILTSDMRLLLHDSSRESFEEICGRNDFDLLQSLQAKGYFKHAFKFNFVRCLNAYVDHNNKKMARFVLERVYRAKTRVCTHDHCENTHVVTCIMATVDSAILKNKFSIADCALEFAEHIFEHGCDKMNCVSFGYVCKNIISFGDEVNMTI